MERGTGVWLTQTLDDLTRALGDGTRRAIYLWAREQHDVTASSVAAHFNLHPNVARHHLDRLVEAGYLAVVSQGARHQVGRPSKRYRAEGSRAPFEGLESQVELLAALVGGLLAEVPADRAARIAYEVGRAHGAALASTAVSESASGVMRAVATALRRSGFAAEADGTETIRQHGCPFGLLTEHYPALCATERGILDGLLDGLGDGTLDARPIRGTAGSCEVRMMAPPHRASRGTVTADGERAQTA
ncbi:putative transcriptional regulator [Acidimicrobium ferrooxidans DSM 10331]|uniref:Putative transcriptional regulator n=1 Tax=Acidimicrobium ferrooxidans (strain DSM 10331 / JCM 15462 / NBRC 103882 / ICP) TaxID=525909 RepID=C7M2S0_ACIFD|nr:helix-turn-helix domain-containing protein [Acidimicrobium ferrooxidans]ACU53314.1 putative transcriptional regulator [Acidimicrobium ferrooxidans DSM 10331]